MKRFLTAFLTVLLILLSYFFIGKAQPAKEITWGVDFSQKHAQNLGLDWRKTYLAILDDLGVQNLKLSTAWDLLEREEGIYEFQDLDWQITEAEKRGAKIILVFGMKTPRWPECHTPVWVRNENDGYSASAKIKNQKSLLEYIEKIVNRYKDDKTIWAWQVENEPLFPFGECPKPDKKFLKDEVALVKKLDESVRPIIISDSGEWSFWINAAKIGDIVGTTLYRGAWVEEIGAYVNYPFPPVFYHRKADLIKKFFGKKVINIELQAEPWGPKLLYETSLEEQKRTMDLARLRKNLEFARKTGFDTFYLWGVEWWYWLKEKKGDSSFWNEAKTILPTAAH